MLSPQGGQGREDNPDGPGMSQVLQDLKQFSLTLGKSPGLEDSIRAETFLRGRV